MSPLRIAAWVAAIALIAGAFALGHHGAAQDGALELAKYQQGVAQDNQRATAAQLEYERAQAVQFDETAKKFEQDKANAKATSDRVVADLRSGNLRLQQRWATQVLASQAATAAGPGGADAGADDRAESAGRIVRAAAECDAQVRGLQDILTKERQ
jgi:Bacteriophage lysis protein.